MKTIMCRRCEKKFQSLNLKSICLNCSIIDVKEYKKIREYIMEHPGITVANLATDLKIQISVIKYYLREERIEIIGDNSKNLFFSCEECGKPIRAGHWCGECLGRLQNEGSNTAIEVNNNYKKSVDAAIKKNRYANDTKKANEQLESNTTKEDILKAKFKKIYRENKNENPKVNTSKEDILKAKFKKIYEENKSENPKANTTEDDILKAKFKKIYEENKKDIE